MKKDNADCGEAIGVVGFSRKMMRLFCDFSEADEAFVPIGGPPLEDAPDKEGAHTMASGTESYLSRLEGIARNEDGAIVDQQFVVYPKAGVVGGPFVDTIGGEVDEGFGHGGVVLHSAHVLGQGGEACHVCKSAHHGVAVEGSLSSVGVGEVALDIAHLDALFRCCP